MNLEADMTPEETSRRLFGLLRADSVFPQDLSVEEWQSLVQFAELRAAGPLLYDRLRTSGSLDQIPAATAAALKQEYLKNAARNLGARAQLEELLTALTVREIPAILLKGAYFNFSIYRSPALRRMSDLDLLLRQADLPAAAAVMQGLGYVMEKAEWENPGHHLTPFVRPGAPFPVEVHWELTSPNRADSIPAARVWQTAQPFQLSGLPCWVCSPAVTLFHICQHSAYQHLFTNGIQALCDLDACLRAEDFAVDWNEFLRLAQDTGCQRGTALALGLAERWLGAPLPQPAIDFLAAQSIPAEMFENAAANMAAGIELPDAQPVGWRESIVWWVEKIKKTAGAAARVRAQEPVLNPDSTNPMRSVRRLGYILRDNAAAAVQLFRQDRSDPRLAQNRRLRAWLRSD